VAKRKRRLEREARREARAAKAAAEEAVDVDLELRAEDEDGVVLDHPMSHEEMQDKGMPQVTFLDPKALRRNPYGGYHWEGPMLLNGRKEPVGMWPHDFEPRWKREHRRRMAVLAAFYEKVEPYWKPRMELLE
jgi:hypothetical protein